MSKHVQAALADLTIPKLDISMAEEGDEPELELVDDPDLETSMDTSRVPVIISISQVCQFQCRPPLYALSFNSDDLLSS